MPDVDSLATVVRRTPWNKGKLIGAKPPLRPNQVWSIRTRLLIERRTRDLALFNLAIDSKLRGLDPRVFSTHSLRRTKATLIYRGHTKIESTVRYLGIEVDDALAIAEQVDV
jgi:hypothetical protein